MMQQVEWVMRLPRLVGKFALINASSCLTVHYLFRDDDMIGNTIIRNPYFTTGKILTKGLWERNGGVRLSFK